MRYQGVTIRDKTDKALNVQPDNAASNGVVHILDKMLLPQAELDALDARVH
ncbi:fasciclin domain-containing protein [Robiginitalea aurantiaca]|uniref:fasciclin domain-containing protein n=1 Tax=Robiginitalea aurantiaca TaxID=3056915 RepID=UPI00336BFCF0